MHLTHYYAPPVAMSRQCKGSVTSKTTDIVRQPCESFHALHTLPQRSTEIQMILDVSAETSRFPMKLPLPSSKDTHTPLQPTQLLGTLVNLRRGGI